MNPSVTDDVKALRTTGAWLEDDSVALIEISGEDAVRFLQARLSNDVAALAPGQGQATAFLDRRAYILLLATLHRVGDRFLMMVSHALSEQALALLDEFKFRERVNFKLLKKQSCIRVESTKADLLLLRLLGKPQQLPAAPFSVLETDSALIIRQSTTGEDGLVIFLDSAPDKVVTECGAVRMVNVSREALRVCQTEAGYLGLDVRDVLLPETGLDAACVSYTKGCFPGQEVLARIRTYGAPRRGIAGFVFEPGARLAITVGATLASPTAIHIAGEEIGTIQSAVYSPTLDRTIAIAIVQREYRVPDQNLTIDIAGAPYSVTTTTLPFVNAQGKAEEAQKLYKKALEEFAGGSEAESIKMLRQVIELQPMFGDAYETLGVILNRHDELDEAIALMKQLAALDANSIMAHANLSVFYMQKGDKEAAEEEKAIAMSIRMSELARGAAEEQREAEERAKMKAAAADRMAMFQQVLQIDPEDFLANAGLGSVHVDLEQYAEAIPYLQKALTQKPNHTVAYVSLGEAFEKLGKTADAVETYKRGIAVAAQRGDGEPLKKMQIRLNKIAPAAEAAK